MHTHGTLACEFNQPAISLLARKNGLETSNYIFEAQVKFNDFATWPFSPVPGRPCLSHAKTCYISHAHFMHQRLLWDIPESFGAKDDEAANFKKIIRV